MSTLTAFDAAQISAIAEDVFAALIDGEPGHLYPSEPASADDLADPMYAWVDMHADVSGRVLLTVDLATAHDLARALLRMDAGEPVEDEDLVDAFGEVANVVGGNLKALLPVQGTLTLPRVARTAPSHPDATVVDRVPLAWRGQPFDISVWRI
jgi:chemotaxis protein CheX